ncbi:phosphotransferase family protein [Rhodococcus koreensis]
MKAMEEHHLVHELTQRATVAARRFGRGIEITGMRPLTGGASSLTFVAEASNAGRIVLKVAPPGLKPVRNRDVLRQGRLMSALRDEDGVRVPGVLFTDPGASPDVSPFVAMEFVPGECTEPILDGSRAEHSRQMYERYLDAARMLGHLHRVRPADVGLGDEPKISLRDEIDRWTKAFETVPEYLKGDFGTCHEALQDTAPEALPPVINHGDYRLGNTLCDGARVTAVIDWEIWSIGDPRIDLSWLIFFTDEGGHPAAVSKAPTGTPSKMEVIEEYERAVGVPMPDIAWFDALTRYKEAAATALLIKRARKYGQMSAELERMEPAIPTLIGDAIEMVGR